MSNIKLIVKTCFAIQARRKVFAIGAANLGESESESGLLSSRALIRSRGKYHYRRSGAI